MASATHIAICDVCKKDMPIVLVCMIGCRLCAACQENQQRISFEELTDNVVSAVELPNPELEAWLWDYPDHA